VPAWPARGSAAAISSPSALNWAYKRFDAFGRIVGIGLILFNAKAPQQPAFACAR
jgi:hypothetical protein